VTTAELAAPPEPHATEEPSVLIVDDSAVDRLVVGRLITKAGGWRVSYAADGVAALEMIEQSPPSIVLTDMQMPRMGGLELVEQVRAKFPRIPVVLVTGHGSEEIAIAALQAGAASYVPKRNLADGLLTTLEQVLTGSRTDEKRMRVLRSLAGRLSRFVLDNDPGLVTPLVTLFREDLLAVGLCDPTGATRAGIALEEALLNAIYHGNLGVSSDLKQAGDGSAFQKLANQRRGQSPYRERRVRVTARVTPEKATFVIADEGAGFDVSKLPDPTDPENLLLPHGRGVLFMRTFMDDVRYNATGNRVTLVKCREQTPRP
jgi:CheY-like chemotaxis protein/anti-sigma regulatory factor (Ser/Thr protein kinase)